MSTRNAHTLVSTLAVTLAVTMTLLAGCSEAPTETGAAPVESTASEPAAEQVELRYSEDWGPALGSTLPLLDADDHTGTRRTLADLTGEEGLLLIVSRSADW